MDITTRIMVIWFIPSNLINTMTFFNKKILSIKKNPITIFKIDDFFDLEFYSDIKKLFSNINPKNIDLAKSLGKVHFNSNQLVFDDITKKKNFFKTQWSYF